MKVLKLTLTKKWFDMILEGDKKTEYREIKPYWAKRLINYKKVNTNFDYFYNHIFIDDKFSFLSYMKDYTHIQFFNGGHYSEKLRNFTIELNSIGIGKGIKQWGANPYTEYFCLYLGEIINDNNC